MQFFTSQAHFSQSPIKSKELGKKRKVLCIDICRIGLYRAVTLNKGIDFCDFGPNISSTLYSFTTATNNQTVQDEAQRKQEKRRILNIQYCTAKKHWISNEHYSDTPLNG